MLIKLYRNEPQGSAITGRLVIDGRWFCNTLERKGYQILALFYPVKVTHSPRFKRLLPLVCGVPRSESKVESQKSKVNETSEAVSSDFKHSTLDIQQSAMRSGIRFHRGTKPQHSTGCILVPADKEKQLTDLILKTQNNHEEILLEVIDYSPGTQYGYDHPCPSSECACEKEIRTADFARRHSSS